MVSRKTHAEAGSYTAYLYEKGLEKILKKVGEECTEVIIAAMKEDNNTEVVNVIGDLIYHLFVMMAEKASRWMKSTRSWPAVHRRPAI